jgi:hypothetical protein
MNASTTASPRNFFIANPSELPTLGCLQLLLLSFCFGPTT